MRLWNWGDGQVKETSEGKGSDGGRGREFVYGNIWF